MSPSIIILCAIFLWHVILLLVAYLLYKRFLNKISQEHKEYVSLLDNEHEEQLKELEVLFTKRVEDDEKVIREYEKVIEKFNLYYANLANIIRISNERIQLIDAKGSFKSDDEVGFFFKNLKEIQESLNTFDLKKVPTLPVQDFAKPSPIKEDGASNIIHISADEAEQIIKYADSTI